MSNIQKTIEFLRQNPEKHFIQIINQETSNPVGPAKIYLRDIQNEDLKAYLKYQTGALPHKSILVWVELRKENGSSTSKVSSFPVEVTADVQHAEIIKTPNNDAMMPQNTYQPIMQHTGQHFGLGIVEIVQAKTDAALLIEVREQLRLAREEIQDLKHEKKLLELDNIDLKTKVGVSEQQKELAVLLANANQKGFFDGEGFQKLMDKVPDMIEKMAVIKGGQPAQESMLGNPDISEQQKLFIEHVIDHLNDEQVALLGACCHFINIEDFKSDLRNLLTQYNNNNNGQ